MKEVILGIRVGHGRARVGWVEVLFSLSNLTCRDRPHPPRARARGNLLHSGLALARPPLRSSPRINLQKLCYTAVEGLSGNCIVAVGKLGSSTSRFTSSVLLVTLYAMNPRISLDPRICHGKPTIRGTRVLVSTLLGALAGGDSMEQIQQDYQIAKEDIVAALEFAREASDCQISIYEAVA